MNRADLHKLTRLRLREAKLLLDNKCYEGAFYLAGYAVECALKACIARKTRRFEFPQKAFEDNWAVVKDWREDARYETKIDKNRANDLYVAITADPNGVLSWLKKYW